MSRRYVTVDVFTDRAFGGNPLAVVLEAQGLSSTQMQAIATEFNYSETTFVLPPRNPHHSAQVRIFTARTEVPFAGHPNVGTAVVLAHELEKQGEKHGDKAPDTLLFEEAAGLVAIRLLREGSRCVGAEFAAPQPLTVGAAVPVEDAAECLSLGAEDVRTQTHSPVVLSVGLPFLVLEVSPAALPRSKPVLAAHERVLPAAGTDAVFAYARGSEDGSLRARMFSPLDATVEDPATGSASAALIAHLAALSPRNEAEQSWRIEQGVEMGRPSVILGRTVKRAGIVREVHVGGRAVPVMHGILLGDTRA